MSDFLLLYLVVNADGIFHFQVIVDVIRLRQRVQPGGNETQKKNSGGRIRAWVMVYFGNINCA